LAAEPDPPRPPGRACSPRPAAARRSEPQELHRPRRGARRPAGAAARPAPGRQSGGGSAGRGAAGRHRPRARRGGDGAVPRRLVRRGGGRVSLLRFLEILTWRDAVDVLAVAIIIYNLLLLIRGTRAVQMLLGLFFLGVVYYAAVLAELPTLQRILENLLIVLPFAIIVLFQGEIRRALADFGRNPLWGLTKQQKVVASFSEIVLASTTLST